MIVNGKEINLDQPTGFDIVKFLSIKDCIAIKVDGVAQNLSEKVVGNIVEIVGFDSFGKSVFWHTTAHLLAQAILRIYPDALPVVGPSVKNGFYYDFHNLLIQEEGLVHVEEEMKRIVKENPKIVRKLFDSKEEALRCFDHNKFKIDIIKDLEGPITAYTQGEFCDLCKGPHIPSLKLVKYFKLTSISASRWNNGESLTRVYGISFPNKTLFEEHLYKLEEAKKRDHKILGKSMALFMFNEYSPGIPFWLPNGMVIWKGLQSLLRDIYCEGNYQEIKSPILFKQELWKKSGHFDNYKEHIYFLDNFAIKPMNCPGAILYYKLSSRSYRDLPFRVAELGCVHRKEDSGSLQGLLRVRSFHQDDGHIFLSQCDLEDEIFAIMDTLHKVYSTFGLKYRMELSTENKSGMNDSDIILQEVMRKKNISFTVNEGEGAFYGPKIDVHVVDSLDRSWQCGTIQLDRVLPKKFDLDYIGKEGVHKRLVLVHRAILGSLERFVGILIEHFGGNFPLWISPNPLKVLVMDNSHLNFAKKVASTLKLSCPVDNSQESISKKVYNAKMEKVNYIVTIGQRESETGKLSVRTRNDRIFCTTLEKFAESVDKEYSSRSLESLF